MGGNGVYFILKGEVVRSYFTITAEGLKFTSSPTLHILEPPPQNVSQGGPQCFILHLQWRENAAPTHTRGCTNKKTPSRASAERMPICALEGTICILQ